MKLWAIQSKSTGRYLKGQYYRTNIHFIRSKARVTTVCRKLWRDFKNGHINIENLKNLIIIEYDIIENTQRNSVNYLVEKGDILPEEIFEKIL